MTTTSAAPGAAPPSIAAITSTAGPPLPPPQADPPVASGSQSQLSHAPLGLPAHFDGGTSNLAQTAKATDLPPSVSVAKDPSAPVSLHAALAPLSLLNAFSVAGALVTPMAGSSGIFVMEGVTLTQGVAMSVIDGIRVSRAPASMFINGEGASISATSPALPLQPALEGQLFGGAIVISGSTGAAPIVISGTTYSPTFQLLRLTKMVYQLRYMSLSDQQQAPWLSIQSYHSALCLSLQNPHPGTS